MGGKPRGFTLVEIMIVVAIIGILAALAIPNFIKFQARAKQSEAKQGLRGYWMAETQYFSEHDSFTSVLGDLSYLPERGNRFSYRGSASPGTWQDRSSATPTRVAFVGLEVDCFKLGALASCVPQPAAPSALASMTVTYPTGTSGPTTTGVTPGASGGYILEAIGSVDNDSENDDWVVSSASIVLGDTACNEASQSPAGIATARYDDVACP